MENKTLNVALLGQRFMGRAHSNAWLQAPRFFDLPLKPVLKVAVGRDDEVLSGFAENWGWEGTSTDWKEVIEREDIHVIDISLPTHLHHEVAMAAAKAGKHIFCEKPFCRSVGEAEEMKAAAEKAGVVHYVNHNYRRCPAVSLAKRLIEAGEIGEVYHWRGAYQQGWLVSPDTPHRWQLTKEGAQGGPLWDLHSHTVDLAHYLVGDISTVQCRTKTFIEERPLSDGTGGTGKVTVDDAALMMVEFCNGALGTFEATRYASGRMNRNTFELYGSKGAMTWDLEDMNRLKFYSNADGETRGWRDILATDPSHPYVANWWPPGHIVGYEHSFVHAVADFVVAVEEGNGILPDFGDGLKILQVLEAAQKAATTGGVEVVS